ncbi:aminomethyltransferase family protein [Mesorhizobium ciceri]|uniref:aminomethyltransferase family protein n=1 Tax=Mesorhizobium TaxID=68287 RepID=UPI0007A940BC|nr:aminomethyltransferase family protein [Mesorhizobium ciceri]AMX98896.1 glycine cleavage system protein T [Mesorhizobium ciceri biovar biserrulae]
MTSSDQMHKSFPRDHYRKPLKETAFYPRISELSTTHDWHGWAGYLAAGVITNESTEYFSIRNSTSVFDITPMVKYRITGPDSAALLDKMTLRDITKLAPGRVQYTAWCNDDGKVIDDGTIFRRSADEFMLFCQERHFAWLCDSAVGFDVSIDDVSEDFAGLSVQGPTSCTVLKEAGFTGIETLRPFGIRDSAIDGARIMISRTGFTGDLGYELVLSPENALGLWDRLFDAGALYGITSIGSKALNLARLEAGFIVTNSDFVSAAAAIRAERRRSPFEIGLGWMIAFDKSAHFTGRTALLREQLSGKSRYTLVGLDTEGNVPAVDSLVYLNGNNEIGHITAAAWSPTAKRNIAIASLQSKYIGKANDNLWVEIYTLRELGWRKLKVRTMIVDRPFFTHTRRSATPPAAF